MDRHIRHVLGLVHPGTRLDLSELVCAVAKAAEDVGAHEDPLVLHRGLIEDFTSQRESLPRLPKCLGDPGVVGLDE